MIMQTYSSLSDLMHTMACDCPMCKAKRVQTGEHEAPGQPIDINMNWNKTQIGDKSDE